VGEGSFIISSTPNGIQRGRHTSECKEEGESSTIKSQQSSFHPQGTHTLAEGVVFLFSTQPMCNDHLHWNHQQWDQKRTGKVKCRPLQALLHTLEIYILFFWKWTFHTNTVNLEGIVIHYHSGDERISCRCLTGRLLINEWPMHRIVQFQKKKVVLFQQPPKPIETGFSIFCGLLFGNRFLSSIPLSPIGQIPNGSKLNWIAEVQRLANTNGKDCWLCRELHSNRCQHDYGVSISCINYPVLIILVDLFLFKLTVLLRVFLSHPTRLSRTWQSRHWLSHVVPKTGSVVCCLSTRSCYLGNAFYRYPNTRWEPKCHICPVLGKYHI